SRLRYYAPSETTRIFAADGTLIGTLYKENRTWVPLEEISDNMKEATLAIEDRRFRMHRGVDPVGVVRAAYLDFKGRDRQGASTITMQLARNLFLTPKRSIDRKIREALLAVQIEKKFTKDEILELYLNQIYFGAGAHGVHAAANVYFGKKAKDLTVAESAMLAGLPQAPTQYSPLIDRKSAEERQLLVLNNMRKEGFINDAEFHAALDETRKMKFVNKDRKDFVILKVPYFTAYVIKQLSQRYDEDLLYRGGLRIYTTVDVKLQQKCEALLKQKVATEGPMFNIHTGAIVLLENKTGFIKAMVGGTGWSDKNQFNRAWQARRQPGSSFKMFVYTTAMEAGMTPDTVVPDSPVTYTLGPGDVYSPRNSDGGFLGAVPLRTALQYSRNVVAVRLLMMLGPERVIDYAYRMGVREKLEPVPSLALGACDISPLEMAQAYSVLANGGIRIEASPIKIIYDSEGNIVEDHRFPHYEEILAESTAYYMTEMLMNAVRAGTGYAANIEGKDCAGKTGTTNDHRDIWFCGYTVQYTCTVWAGNDDFTQMYGVFGGDFCAPLWKAVMLTAMKDKPWLKFSFRKGNQLPVLMCTVTNKRAGPHCPKVYRQLCRPGELPTMFCDTHGAVRLPTVGTGPSRPGPTTTKATTTKAPEPLPDPGMPGEMPTPVEIPLTDVPPGPAAGDPLAPPA
ncbi:MAG: PBP1A family penicillin-binding protein, partial [Candidatus Eremiobacterota bacterium]